MINIDEFDFDHPAGQRFRRNMRIIMQEIHDNYGGGIFDEDEDEDDDDTDNNSPIGRPARRPDSSFWDRNIADLRSKSQENFLL